MMQHCNLILPAALLLYFVAIVWPTCVLCQQHPPQAEKLATRQIKELDEPKIFPVYGGQQQQQQYQRLLKSVPARQDVSCPAFMANRLRGRCFTLQSGHYEFRLCPFDNATQRDVSYSMLTMFHGVIGVWDGWQVDSNGTLVAMVMPNGDPCPVAGSRSEGLPRRRETVVRLVCPSRYQANGSDSSVKENEDHAGSTRLVSVRESPTCRYNMALATPLACHPDAMLAYPCLANRPNLQAAWDAAFTLRSRGLVNESSYKHLLDNLLFRANLLANALRINASSSYRDLNPSLPYSTVSSYKPLSADSVVEQIQALQRQIERYHVSRQP